jgi:carboxyl-terminal processing protease
MSPDRPQPQHPRPGLDDLPGFSGLGRAHLLVRAVAVALLLVLLGVTAGMVLERSLVRSERGSDDFPYLDTVADVVDGAFYYRPTSPEAEATVDAAMQQQAIAGALSALEDPYTRYLGPEQSQTAQEDLDGRYGGIGVDVMTHEGTLVVSNIVPESPADEAGLVRMDEISAIDGAPVDLTDLDGLVRQLRGEIGSEVKLDLRRPATGRSFSITLVREEIVVPVVSARIIEGTSVGWIRISLFGTDTLPQLDAALASLQADGANAVILDVRGNSGGYVDAAQGVIGRFVDADDGPAMYEDTQPGDGGELPMPILPPEDGLPVNLPLVVLVDGGSASASEIVAGALQDYDRALVIGEPTFGKGSVQRIYTFPDSSSIRVTVAEWFTPRMARIQDTGIIPDVQVAATDPSAGGDPVLERAIALVSGDSELAEGGATPEAP